MNGIDMPLASADRVLGPCGNVNYVTDVALEQDTLTCALIDLARVLECGHEESLPSLTSLIVGGLVFTDSSARLRAMEVRQMTVRVVEALMRRCYRRMHPPFDMAAIWQAPRELAALKTLLLLGIRGTAANAARMICCRPNDRIVGRHFVAALSTLANEDSAAGLLPLARDIGRVNFRCLDCVHRHRTEVRRTGVRQLGMASRADEGSARLSLRSEGEAEDALVALSSQAELRALKHNASTTSIALGWYGPASVCMLLTLLALGVKDIQLGPERPTFLPQPVADLLQNYFKLESQLFVEAV